MTKTSSHNLMSRRLFSKRKGFTLLELVVALVVLAILAALSIPTYESVINSAKTGVADATAIAAAQDAIAIAATDAGTGSGVATEANLNTVLSTEDNGVSLISYNDTSGETTASLSVALNGGSQSVCVNWPDQVNAAPTLCASTTTTTIGGGGSDLTATPDPEGATCSVTVTGPFSNGSTPSDWSLSCSGITGTSLFVSVPVGTDTGDGNPGIFIMNIVAAGYQIGPSGGAGLPSSFTVDQDYTNPTSGSPSATPYVNLADFLDAGAIPNIPQSAVGELNYSSLPDSCVSSGVDCGTPAYVLSGF